MEKDNCNTESSNIVPHACAYCEGHPRQNLRGSAFCCCVQCFWHSSLVWYRQYLLRQDRWNQEIPQCCCHIRFQRCCVPAGQLAPDSILRHDSSLTASTCHGKADFPQLMVCFQSFSYSFSLPTFLMYSECVLPEYGAWAIGGEC